MQEEGWAGHVARMEDEKWAQTTCWDTEGK
jgi:hypothetical protein